MVAGIYGFIDWRVTRSLVSYVLKSMILSALRINWRVTRSLVSYVIFFISNYLIKIYWRVTRSLVSYVLTWLLMLWLLRLKGHQIVGELRPNLVADALVAEIEGSPDRWWVTSYEALNIRMFITLKGHQIVGELRLHTLLLSNTQLQLKGHQIVGELRLLPAIRCRESI